MSSSTPLPTIAYTRTMAIALVWDLNNVIDSFLFQLDKLLTFNSRVLIFPAWLLNFGNTRLLDPAELPHTACLKCGWLLKKLKWGLLFSANTRKFLMFYTPLFNTNPSPPLPPKTMQMTLIKRLGLVSSILNAEGKCDNSRYLTLLWKVLGKYWL